MSLLKGLHYITENEKISLQDLLLERVVELEEKKEELLVKFDTDHPKVIDLENLIKFNNYLYHWVEHPSTEYLQ